MIYLKWINFRVDKISRIEILDFSRGQNFANRGVPKISRGQNFAKRGSFKFRDFENPILLQVLSVKIGLLL